MAGMGLAASYGAGGAAKGLSDVLEQRFVAQRLAEQERAQREQEALQRADMKRAAQSTQFNQMLGLAQLKSLDQSRLEAAAARKEEIERRANEDEIENQRRVFEQEQAFKREGREQEWRAGESQKDRDARLEAARVAAAGANARSDPGGDYTTFEWTDAEGVPHTQRMTNAQAAAMGAQMDQVGGGRGGTAQARQREKFGEMYAARELGRQILEDGEKLGWRGTGPAGSIWAKVKEKTVGNKEAIVRLRSRIQNLYSLIGHERFGGALTTGERSTLDSFMASTSMPSSEIIGKVTEMLNYLDQKMTGMGGEGAKVWAETAPRKKGELPPPSSEPLKPGQKVMLTPPEGGAGAGIGAGEFDFVPGKGLVPRVK